ncbi:MAG: LPS export ABC transporter periplasmic protein LptC [Candidatus Omnitrophica bacterium]|nr:LPS export ABC transporter periplasmic protein LptC [Candidatus Omnitrophota bacterium]
MKHPIRRRLIYLAFQGLRGLIQWLPLELARAFGRLVGTAAYGLLPLQRRLALEHVRAAFGETLTAAQRRGIVRRMFLNLGQNGMEWLQLPRWSAARLQRLITSDGVEHLRQALAEGHGAIVVSGHLGNWELMPLYLRSLGFEGQVLARRLRYPEYEQFLIGLRRRFGISTLVRGSLKDVAKLLRENKIVGMLPDQDTDSLDGVFVDFLGQPAYTSVGPAALSVMTHAPIVPVFNVREGKRFHLIVEPPLRVPDSPDRMEAIQQLTQAWSDVVASYITRYPDHWVWMHRRWKTKPSLAHSTQHTANSQQQPAKGSQMALALCAVCCLLFAELGCGKRTSQATTEESAATGAPNATQHMSGFTLTGYQDDGSKKWQLNGQGATVEGNIVTIHQPNAIGFDPVRQAHLTASLAQVNQNNRHIRLEHNVTIHTDDGLWFFSPVLYWIPDQNKAATDLPVRIESDHMLLRGRGFSGMTQLKQAVIASDIEMVLNPSDHEPLSGGAARQVTITCDGPLSFDYGTGVATFEHNVHIKDPNGDVYSDKLIAYLDQANHTIRYAEAIGRVRIHQHQNTALSEKAVYEPAIGKITLVGKPSLLIYPQQGEGQAQLSFGGLLESKPKVPLPHQPKAPES